MKQIPTGKKGIFFMSIAILMSAVLIVVFAVPATVTIRDQIPITKAKAEAANSQARDLKHSYLPQSLNLAAYSAFYAMAEYMRQRGDYFQGADANLKLEATLKEMIINGTMCCGLPGHLGCNSDSMTDINKPELHETVQACTGLTIMNGRSLSKRLTDIEEASSNAFRINTSFFKDYPAMTLKIYQDNTTGPWQVGLNLTVNYSIAAGEVMINKTENVSAKFPIKGIPDPLYLVESQRTAEDGNVMHSNYFNATNITKWNITTFYRQIEWRLYRHDKNASSFLMRFNGQDAASPCCGVESLINPLTMTAANGMAEKPYVDWCYYGPSDRCTPAQTGNLWNITCVTTEADGTKFYRFALDTYHALEYNLTNAQKDYLYGAGPPPACAETPFP